jgi:hypothetical protein
MSRQVRFDARMLPNKHIAIFGFLIVGNLGEKASCIPVSSGDACVCSVSDKISPPSFRFRANVQIPPRAMRTDLSCRP